jgi:hypothetical protein
MTERDDSHKHDYLQEQLEGSVGFFHMPNYSLMALAGLVFGPVPAAHLHAQVL